jgi:hypothetical protein
MAFLRETALIIAQRGDWDKDGKRWRGNRSESAEKKAGVAAWRVAGLGLTGLHVLALSAGDALRVWRTASPGPNDAPLLVGGQSAANFACVSARASRGARYQPGYDHVLRKQRRGHSSSRGGAGGKNQISSASMSSSSFISPALFCRDFVNVDVAIPDAFKLPVSRFQLPHTSR